MTKRQTSPAGPDREEPGPAATQVRPHEAMLSYLDALLQDVTAPPSAPEQAVAAPAPAPPAPALDSEVELDLLPAAPAPVVAERTVATTAAMADPDEFPRPDWASARFESLLVDVGGLTLAIPLVELGGILKLGSKQPGSLPGQPAWYLGLVESEYGRLQVVDAARWIMPDKVAGLERESPRFLVRLGDSPWALAVDRVLDARTLGPESVQWRGRRSRRRWLAGTVKEQMCALLDVPAMAALMDQRRDAGE